MVGDNKVQPNLLLKTIVTACALVVTATHIWVPSINVDAITVALLMVAALPWLQPIFKSIKLPGGFEITLHELKQEVANAAGAAQSAERKADLAMSGLATGQPDPAMPEAVKGQPDRLTRLADEYEDIRAKQAAGPARTQAMTNVVRQMMALAHTVASDELPRLLRETRRGRRLEAYVALYARPDPVHLKELVHSVTRIEDKPFGQYWGLQAIGRNIGSNVAGDDIDRLVGSLRDYAERVPKGSDREYEVGKLLAQLSVRDGGSS